MRLCRQLRVRSNAEDTLKYGTIRAENPKGRGQILSSIPKQKTSAKVLYDTNYAFMAYVMIGAKRID